MQPIKPVVVRYIADHPDEVHNLRQLLDFVEHADEVQMIDTKFAVGHFTVSAFVLSPTKKEILLINHKVHRMHLQPGGPILSTDSSLCDAAKRIVKEETGVTELYPLRYHYDSETPFDIDVHAIKARPEIQEQRHWHHDLRYVFITPQREINKTGEQIEWFPLEELRRYNTFERAVNKLQSLLDPAFAINTFYYQLAETLNLKTRPSVILVTHALPDALPFIEVLGRVAHIKTLIPKKKSINSDVLKRLESKHSIRIINRASGAEDLAQIIDEITDPTVIYDIGGYFADVPAISSEACPKNLLGIVEDTENGHKRYSSNTRCRVPVISVARSPLKDNEDFLIGQSIVFSADAVMREVGRLFQYSEIGVLGFGKIGQSIVHHALQRDARVMLYDIVPSRRVKAYNRGASVPSRYTLLTTADVIFSATGNHSLSILDIRNLKNGCFLFSVTSSDDEIDLTFLEGEYLGKEVAPYIIRYDSFHNFFYLVNGGNAVNFIHRAVVGDFIHLVKGEMLLSLKQLAEGGLKPGVHENPEEMRNLVADTWLSKCISQSNGSK